VNGEVHKNTEAPDMIFSIAKIISHLSRGTTLREGTIIETGTPSGVARGLSSSLRGLAS
jgi:transcription initiation factor TFIIH subunit 2